MSRASILQKVRSALDKVGQVAEPPPAPPVLLRSGVTSELERVAEFRVRLEALKARTYQAATVSEARALTAQILNGRGAIASNATFLRECGIVDLAEVRTGFTEQAALREACVDVAAGITCADYALAETGTLVMLSSVWEARMISLLPPCHVAIVPRSRILKDLDEFFRGVPFPAEKSSSTVFITGPSRTGDIEGLLVHGVHGPGEMHVVIV